MPPLLPLFPLLPTGTTVVQQTLLSYAPRSSYSRRRRRTASASISVPHEASSRAHAYTHTLMHGHFSCGNSSNNTDTDLADQHQQHIPRRCTQTLSNEILLFPLSLSLQLTHSSPAIWQDSISCCGSCRWPLCIRSPSTSVVCFLFRLKSPT